MSNRRSASTGSFRDIWPETVLKLFEAASPLHLEVVERKAHEAIHLRAESTEAVARACFSLGCYTTVVILFLAALSASDLF